jgi:uncharacterized protein
MIELDGRRYFVFDGHTHLGEYKKPRGPMPTAFWGDQMVANMDAAGVDVVSSFFFGVPVEDIRPLNEGVLAAQAQYPDRICAYARIQPERDNAVEELQRLIAAGVRGVKFHPLRDGGYIVNDLPLMGPLFEVIAATRLPVLIHSGELWTCTPALIADLARQFPSVPVIVGHSGQWEYQQEAVTVARQVDNLILETSLTWPPGFIKTAVGAIGAERVIMGSDAPTYPFALEILKVARYAGITPDEVAQVVGLTMARLAGVDPGAYADRQAIAI